MQGIAQYLAWSDNNSPHSFWKIFQLKLTTIALPIFLPVSTLLSKFSINLLFCLGQDRARENLRKDEETSSTGTPASMSPASSPRLSEPRYEIEGREEPQKEKEITEFKHGCSSEDQQVHSPESIDHEPPVSPCIPYIPSRSNINRSSALPQTQLEVLTKIFPAYPTDLLQLTLMESRGSVSQAVERVLYGSPPRPRHSAPLRSSYGSAFKETEKHESGLTTLSTLSTLIRYCNRCGFRAFATDNFCSACGCILRKC